MRALTIFVRLASSAGLLVSTVMLSACGPDRACITWQAELGACLDRGDAFDELRVNDKCEDSIRSVDSDGVFEDGECCYEVTTADICHDDSVVPMARGDTEMGTD